MAFIRNRKSGFVRVGGVKRRETQWLDIPGSVQNLATPQSAVNLNLLTTAEKALRPFTVVRTRGVFHINSDQAAVTEDQSLALGFCVVSDQAAAIGIAALPTPITDQESDLWFVYEQLMNSFLFLSAVGVGSSTGAFKEYDSRAMRKVQEGQDIAIVAESDIAGLGTGVDIRHGGRLLIKLH